MMTVPPVPDNLRRECADKALHSYGTYYILEKKAARLGRLLKTNTFLGIAGPCMLGIVLGADINQTWTIYVRWIAVGVGAIQLLITIMAATSGWEATLSAALDGQAENARLSEKFSELGNSTPKKLPEFQDAYARLCLEYDHRNKLDHRIHFTDADKRMGMRAALRKYRRPCAGCKIVPTSLKANSSNCNICGDF